MSFLTIRNSVIAALAALVLLFPADGLRALGLGEARVDSYLGQPLDVTIRLLDGEGSESVEDLTVSAAGPDDYERLGVPAEALALGLDVSIDRSSQPPRVRLTSSRPVADPIIRVLVNARWSSGRVLREYTLFLDPPTVDSPPPETTQRDTASVADEPGSAEEPSADQPEPTASQPATRSQQRPPAEPREQVDSQPPAAPDDRVAVNAGDTLWSIASAWRPDTSLSMDQVMLAIFERNRNAFINDNINRLRSDVELDMPSVDEAGGISRIQAEQRIREHMQAWQQATPGTEVPEISEAGVAEPEAETTEADEAEQAEQTDTVAQSEQPDEEEDAVHRLDVVPPEEDEHADGPVASDEEVRRIRGQVTELEDELLAERLEGGEYDEQIEEIRELLSTRDAAGVAVAEEMLAELEARLREERRERDEGDEVESYFDDLEEELVDDESDEAEEVAAAGGDGGEADAATDPDGDRSAEEAGSETDQAETESEVAVTETGSDGMSIWVWAGLGLLVVLLAAAGAWLVRRRNAESGEEDFAPVAEDAVAEARREVEAEPTNLAAHLLLLKALADRDDEVAFADALDNMYRRVDDEDDGYWQEALSLASEHAPDHPLLRPTEPPEKDEDDIDQRAEEMMGMLESSQQGSEPEPSGTEEPEVGEQGDLHPEEETGPDTGDEEELLDDDVDLSELSNRMDTPEDDLVRDHSFSGDVEDEDFSALAGDEEQSGEATVPDSGGTEAAADDTTASDGESGDLDLDFEFSSRGDAEELDDIFEEEPETPETPETLELDDGEPELGEEGLEASEPPSDEPLGPADEEAAEPEPEPGDSDEEAPEQAGPSALSDEDSDVKLDLARAYVSVDLTDSARTILEEVISGGSAEKQAEARKLLDDL